MGTPGQFGAREIELFGRRLVETLRSADLKAPFDDEGETSFTRRVLLPTISGLLDALDIHGLISTGDGGDRVLPARYLGLVFRPDIAVLFHGVPIAAVEVKILRDANRQGAVAGGIGQALLYQMAGYPLSLMFIADSAGKTLAGRSSESIKALEERLGIGIVTRVKIRSELFPDQAA